MDSDKVTLVNPDIDIWLGFLAIFMDYSMKDDSWKDLEQCITGYDDKTPIFDDNKVKQILERRGKEFRPYFEEMKKVVRYEDESK